MSQQPGGPEEDPQQPGQEWAPPTDGEGQKASPQEPSTQEWQSPTTQQWQSPATQQWQGQPPPPQWQGQAPPPHWQGQQWQGQPPPPQWQGQPWQGATYPAQQQWHHLPPEELIRLHKPGVIPLRPLNLGDMFGGALTTMRRNPEATIGMAVLVLAVFLLPSLLITLGTRWVTSLAVEDWAVLGILLPGLAATVATLALSGFVIYVVSEAALGDRVGIGQTWRAVRSRIPALIGITLLTGLIIGGAILAFVLTTILLVSALGDLAFLLVILAFLGVLPLMLWLSARVALGPAAVVLERAGPGRGLARSWALTRGWQAWRVLGIILLATILASIFSSIIGLPISFGVQLLVGVVTEDLSAQLTSTVVIEHLVQLVINAVATPFTAGVTALLYLDQRMRREGLDVTMVRAAQDRAASRRV